MTNTQAVIDARRYRLELVLLGMALASGPDRVKITAAVDARRLLQPASQACMTAIGKRDRDAVRAWVERLGAKAADGETMVDAVIRAVIEADDRNRLAGVLAELTAYNHQGSVESLRATINDAQELLGTMESRT